MANFLTRRRFMTRTLQGVGGVTVGLPLLDAGLPSAFAQEPAPPHRALTLFFGNGVPPDYQHEDYNTVLKPLAEFSDRLAMIRGLDQVASGHDSSSRECFRGGDPKKTSLDQYLLDGLYLGGSPTPIQTLSMGTFFRRWKNGNDAPQRYIKSWRDGRIVVRTIHKPIDLFNRLFGGGGVIDGESAVRASVLDAVLDQYQHLLSDNSPLNSLSKGQLSDHFERVRELELRILAGEGNNGLCQAEEPPADTNVDTSLRGDDAVIVPLHTTDWQVHWALMVELYVLAMRCDQFRVGSVVHQAGGDKPGLSGPYTFDGETHTFDANRYGSNQHVGLYHQYTSGDTSARGQELRHMVRFKMQEIAKFLRALDSREFLDANGKTIFENMFFAMSTELGDPNKHSGNNIINFVGTANGRFRSGIYDRNSSVVDLYNTCLQGMGLNRRMGDLNRFDGLIDSILA